MKDIINNLVKQFNSEDVIKFSDKDMFKENKSWVLTGSPELEYNLGVLGFPTGTFIPITDAFILNVKTGN